MTHVTCRLTAKNWDQLRNPTLGNRVWAIFTFNESQAMSWQQRVVEKKLKQIALNIFEISPGYFHCILHNYTDNSKVDNQLPSVL